MIKPSIKFIFFSLLLISITITAQHKNPLNSYQYLLIPTQLSFQDSPNEYNINQIIKATFAQKNFTTFIEGEAIPKHINPCDILRLSADVSGFLATKLTLSFKNCYGNLVYTSTEGKSLEKDFKASFYEALKFASKDKNIENHIYKTTLLVKEEPVKKAPKRKEAVNKTPLKTTENSTILSLRNKEYTFVKIKNNYDIYTNQLKIGTAIQQTNSEQFMLNAGNLSGEGSFDDFGNFILYRVNPANNKTIKDVMARVH